VKSVTSDPFPVTPSLLPPPPPPPVIVEEEPIEEQELSKQRKTPKIYQILGENPSLATVIDMYP
jgi:hypothetical protein